MRIEQGTSGGELAPVGQGGGAGWFENISACDLAVPIESVVDQGMDGGEFPQGFDAPYF